MPTVLHCPKCKSINIMEVPNTTLDVVAKCTDCLYVDFVKKFEQNGDSNENNQKITRKNI